MYFIPQLQKHCRTSGLTGKHNTSHQVVDYTHFNKITCFLPSAVVPLFIKFTFLFVCLCVIHFLIFNLLLLLHLFVLLFLLFFFSSFNLNQRPLPLAIMDILLILFNKRYSWAYCNLCLHKTTELQTCLLPYMQTCFHGCGGWDVPSCSQADLDCMLSHWCVIVTTLSWLCLYCIQYQDMY